MSPEIKAAPLQAAAAQGLPGVSPQILLHTMTLPGLSHSAGTVPSVGLASPQITFSIRFLEKQCCVFSRCFPFPCGQHSGNVTTLLERGSHLEVIAKRWCFFLLGDGAAHTAALPGDFGLVIRCRKLLEVLLKSPWLLAPGEGCWLLETLWARGFKVVAQNALCYRHGGGGRWIPQMAHEEFPLSVAMKASWSMIIPIPFRPQSTSEQQYFTFQLSHSICAHLWPCGSPR